MSSISFRAVAMVALSIVLFGCPKPIQECITGDEDVCTLDASVPPDNVNCNSAQGALSDPDCAVTVGDGCPAARGGMAVVKLGRITTLADGGLDRDFFSAKLPSGLTARCLLHVVAGYSVPQTPVNLSVNVTREDGASSIMSGIDRHNAAAPKLVDLIVPFSESNTKILIQLADEGATVQRKVDNLNDYSLKVEVTENPDPNEPNDATPTAIPLMAATDGVSGTGFGYLATKDDVDTYSFEVTAAGRQIIYLALSSPAPMISPPPPFKLSYGLFDPAGTQIAEGVMANEFLQVDLKTARLAPATGTYKVVVKGYKPEGSTAPILGDLRLRYDLEVRVMPDLDTREPNDNFATAQTVNLANGTIVLNGRISYIADEEWFKLVVGAAGTARTLRYKITVADSGGRFPPLSPVATRQVRLESEVTAGVTRSDRTTNCTNDPAVCPRSFNSLQSSQGQLVSTLCALDPPQCLWAERNEEAQTPGFTPVKNFVGAIPVPTSGESFYLMFRDQGARDLKYADDRVWAIEVTLANDADEQSRVGGPITINLGAAPVDAPGVISFGYGEVLDPFDLNAGRGVRGPRDYDAYETDKDLFQFKYPGGATGDQAWGVEWIIDNNTDGGIAPADLALEVTLCSTPGPLDAGLCGGQRRFILGANLGAITPWYLPVTNGNQRMLFTKLVNTATTTFSATAAGCNCFAGSKVAAGEFYVNVAGINRVTNDPILYRVRQTVAPYPAGNPVCPVGGDGGCRFAGQ